MQFDSISKPIGNNMILESKCFVFSLLVVASFPPELLTFHSPKPTMVKKYTGDNSTET